VHFSYLFRVYPENSNLSSFQNKRDEFSGGVGDDDGGSRNCSEINGKKHEEKILHFCLPGGEIGCGLLHGSFKHQ
jgi:hypothetical protein